MMDVDLHRHLMIHSGLLIKNLLKLPLSVANALGLKNRLILLVWQSMLFVQRVGKVWTLLRKTLKDTEQDMVKYS